jgi:membrane associated rhomboid family serine protease
VKWLIIANCVVFVLQQIAGARIIDWFGLVPWLIRYRGFIWQLFTYMFLHGGIWHLVINMLMLWMFGADLERDWGTRRFLRYYFVCGVGAGLCALTAALVVSSGPDDAMLALPTIGASGAIFGLLLAFGVVYADRIILMMLLFPMKAKYAVMIFGVIEFYYVWQPSRGVSNVAHLGGMLFGYLFLKVRIKGGDPIAFLRNRYRTWRMERARRRFQVYLRKRGPGGDRWVN